MEVETSIYKPFFSKSYKIDLVEIGLLDETGANSYWGVNKEFNLSKAWSINNGRFRRTVLLPIYKKLRDKADEKGSYLQESYEKFSKKSLKNLLDWFGKTKQELRDDIENYFDSFIEQTPFVIHTFYGAYDVVALNQLFSREDTDLWNLPYFMRYIKDLDMDVDELTNYNQEIRNKIFTHHPTFPKSALQGTTTTLEEVFWLRELYLFLEKYKIKND